jgi:very-short-patch-repair endonuclease
MKKAASRLRQKTSCSERSWWTNIARGEEIEGLQVRRPSLEEVYLALTAEEDEAAAEVDA